MADQVLRERRETRGRGAAATAGCRGTVGGPLLRAREGGPGTPMIHGRE